MRIIIVFFVLFINISLFAEKEVVVDEKVQAFLYDMNSSSDLYHRSGLVYNKNENAPESAKKSWNSDKKYNYMVLESVATCEKMKKHLFSEKNLNTKNFNIKSFDKKSTLLVEKKASPKPSDIIPAGSFSKEDYVNIALSYISGIKDLDEAVEIESVAFETSRCPDCEEPFYKEKQVSGIYIRLRRVFEGGVVRGNLSKVLIKLDPDGSLRKLKIKWPEFQKIDKEENAVSFENNMSLLMNDLSAGEDAHVISAMTSIPIEKYEVNGAAKAWVPFVKDGKTYITPAISYKLNVFLKDESMITKIVDSLLIPSYLIYNNKNRD